MTDFVSVLTDIHQQRQFDLPLLREFISTNPPSFVDFFFIKITLCHYSKLKVSFLPVFQGRVIIIIMKCHDFIVKGNYTDNLTDNPSKAEAPVCITAAISPTGQNKLLLLSRWFVGTLGIISFLKKMGHIHSREDMKWFKMEALFMVCSSSPTWFELKRLGHCTYNLIGNISED